MDSRQTAGAGGSGGAGSYRSTRPRQFPPARRVGASRAPPPLRRCGGAQGRRGAGSESGRVSRRRALSGAKNRWRRGRETWPVWALGVGGEGEKFAGARGGGSGGAWPPGGGAYPSSRAAAPRARRGDVPRPLAAQGPPAGSEAGSLSRRHPGGPAAAFGGVGVGRVCVSSESGWGVRAGRWENVRDWRRKTPPKASRQRRSGTSVLGCAGGLWRPWEGSERGRAVDVWTGYEVPAFGISVEVLLVS